MGFSQSYGAGSSADVFANRPAATDVDEGHIFFATDTGAAYRSDGSTWSTAILNAASIGAASVTMAMLDPTSGDLDFVGTKPTVTRSAAGQTALAIKVTGDTANRLAINGAGFLNAGSGAASPDATLKRSDVATWQADDRLNLGGGRFDGYRSADQALGNGSWDSIGWTAEDADTTTDMHDTVTNNDRVYVRADNLFRVDAQGVFATSATGKRGLRVKVNGTQVGAPVIQTAVSGGNTPMQGSWLLELSDGDYVTVEAFQDSGGALNLVSGANGSRLQVTPAVGG